VPAAFFSWGIPRERKLIQATRYTPWGTPLTALGRHLLIELHDCERAALDDLDLVRDTLIEAADRLGSTVLDVATHKFDPHGVTAIVMIAESHLSVHTWPEHGYAALDIFTCSPTMQPADVVGFLSARLRAGTVQTVEVNRGILPMVRAGRPG
jgi:S-adenosylmethionine decarboxylase